VQRNRGGTSADLTRLKGDGREKWKTTHRMGSVG